MLNRYLLKDINTNLFAISAIFMILILGNRSIDIIKSTTLVRVDLIFLFKLITLNAPFALALVLPLAFTAATMISIMRFTMGGEFVVMLAGGKSYKSIFLPIFLNSLFYMVIGLFLTLYVAPLAQNTSIRIMQAEERKVDFSFINPKVMQSFDGRGIYVADISQDKKHLYQVLLFENTQEGWEVTKADLAKQVVVQDKYRSLVLENGKSYKIPNKDLAITEMTFKFSGKVIGEIRKPSEPQRLQALSTKDLIQVNSLATKAQIQWRLSIPLLIPFLLFPAFALSLIDRRNSNYINIFPMFVLVLVSIFACFGLEKSVAKGDLVVYPGIFFLHIGLGIFAFLTLRYKKVFQKEL